MTAKRKSRPRSGAFLALMLFLLAAAIAAIVFFGKIAIDYTMEQYERNTHPLKFSEYVGKYADENELDLYFVYAVIKTESGFDPDAKSSAGARGLMQITEETFDWIKFRLGDGDEITFDSLYEPEQNIRYGTYLLGYLKGVLKNRQCISAGYHAGVNAVLSWLEDTQYSDDGVTLKTIPSSVTRHYVNKIQTAYEIYTKLYDIK